MKTQLLCRLVREEHGYGPLAYVVVTGSFSVLLLQPSLIVGAVHRLSDLFDLFIGQLGVLGQLRFLF